jgi:hypothetical protein
MCKSHFIAGSGYSCKRITGAESKLVSSEQSTSILIHNVRIFDGLSDELISAVKKGVANII